MRNVPTRINGAVGFACVTMTSAWKVQFPSSKTRTTPLAVWVYLVGIPLAPNYTGVRSNVVPAGPLTPADAAATSVMDRIAQPNPRVMFLNGLSFVMVQRLSLQVKVT